MKMGIKKKVILTDFPDFGPITDEVKKDNLPKKFTGGVRINQGFYRTDKEYEEYREKILSTPLP